jgi:hypothetical protein
MMPRLNLISGSNSPPWLRKSSYLALSLCLVTSAISLHSQPASALDPIEPASETLSEPSQTPVTLVELTRKLDQLKSLVAEIEKLTSALQTASATTDASRKIPAVVESSKALLVKAFVDNYPAKEGGLNNILEDLDAFSRASEHSPEVRVETINTIAKIILAPVTTPLSKEERLDIAADLIQNVAFPTVHINQLGSTGTIACLEVRIASRHPEKYSDFVQDFVNKGHYRLLDGHNILFPDKCWTHERAPSKANHASRIFQLGAINLVWQTATELPSHMALNTKSRHNSAAGVERGTVRFVMDGEQGSLRHFSKAHADGVVIKKMADGTSVETPALNPEQLDRVNTLITGTQEIIGFQRVGSLQSKVKGWIEYQDRAELKRLLEDVAAFKMADARFPLMLNAEVNLSTQKRVVSHDNYCSLIHYDPATSKVDIDRTSGFHRDFVYEKALTLGTLWDELQ